MNQEHRFEPAAPGAPAPFQSASELGRAVARARQRGAEKTAAMVATAFRGTARGLRLLGAQLVRFERRRATREALIRCSDRVLADIGIAREDIPLVARGFDPAAYQPRDPALRRWWAAARARLRTTGEARRERRRLYRELDAYDDRELEQIGLRRADVSVVARGQPVLRRAA